MISKASGLLTGDRPCPFFLIIDLSLNNGYAFESLPRQFRGIDAAPKKPWRVLQVEKRVPDAVFQFVNGRRRRVCECLLGLSPNVLVGIELRCVGREVVQMKAPAATQIHTHGFVAVDFGAVPQEHDLAPEVPQQQAKELDDPLPVNVLAVASEVHADPLAGRGDRDRGDDRDPVVPVAMAQDRRPSDRGQVFRTFGVSMKPLSSRKTI